MKQLAAFFIFLSLLFSFQPCIYALKIGEKLIHAKEGDCFVFGHKKSFTLTRVALNEKTNLVLEEVSAPLSCKPKDWQEWLLKNAPGHTSWTLTQIDLKKCHAKKAYCFVRKSHLSTDEAGSFLSILFNLNFEKLSSDKRKKIGISSGSDDLMPKALWQPPIPEGANLSSKKFEAYRARWPKDNSELSNQLIEIYLPEITSKNKAALSYLPYWIEVRHAALKTRVQTLYVGLGIESPKKLSKKTS